MSITSKNIFTWDSSKDRGPRGFPGAQGGVTVPDANDILTALLTVDGTGSGLDADTLDGYHAAYFAPVTSPTILTSLIVSGASYDLFKLTRTGGFGSTDFWISSTLTPGSSQDFAIASSQANSGIILKTRNAGGTLMDGIAIDLNGNVGVGTGGTAIGGKLGILSSGNSTWPLLIKASDAGPLAGVYESDLGAALLYVMDAAGATKVFLSSVSDSFIAGGGLHVGGTSAAGDDNLLVDGTAEITGVTTLTGYTKTVGGVHVGGTSDPGADNLWIDGNAQEPSFAAGWQGTNWQINAAGNAEFNNVRIRGGLSVYELIINQLHYQNGGLIIGAGAGKIATITTSTVGSEVMTFHDPEGNDMVPFTAGSIVVCQRVDISKTVANGYTGDIVKKIVRQVASVSSMSVTMEVTTGWGTGDDTGIFEVGDEVVAVGHTTNAALDSSIYLSATDADNPFMRVFDGVNTYGKWSLGDKSTIKLQLGNLASLASYDILPASPGYGLYCNNVYLTGKMVLPTAGMTDEGSSASDIRIYAGDTYANRATAPFRVTQNGSLTATGIAELGTSAGGDGANVAIKGGAIWVNAGNNDGYTLSLNYFGYQGGNTYTRNVGIYNGKSQAMLFCNGFLDNVSMPRGNVVIGGDTPATSGLLDLQSTSKALIVPRMTEAQANAMTKIAGMIVYMTDLGHFYGYTNAWRILD